MYTLSAEEFKDMVTELTPRPPGVDELLEVLKASGPLWLIVGGRGAGKTLLMLNLARRLAHEVFYLDEADQPHNFADVIATILDMRERGRRYRRPAIVALSTVSTAYRRVDGQLQVLSLTFGVGNGIQIRQMADAIILLQRHSDKTVWTLLKHRTEQTGRQGDYWLTKEDGCAAQELEKARQHHPCLTHLMTIFEENKRRYRHWQSELLMRMPRIGP